MCEIYIKNREQLRTIDKKQAVDVILGCFQGEHYAEKVKCYNLLGENQLNTSRLQSHEV